MAIFFTLIYEPKKYEVQLLALAKSKKYNKCILQYGRQCQVYANLFDFLNEKSQI